MKRATSVMVAALMLASCLTVVAVGSYDDAEATAQGDAWGFTKTYDEDSVMELIYEAIKENLELSPYAQYLVGDDGNLLKIDQIMETYKPLLGSTGFKLDKFNLDFDIQMGSLAEVVGADTNGYTIDLKSMATITLTLDLNITGPIPEDFEDMDDFDDIVSFDDDLNDDDDEDDDRDDEDDILLPGTGANRTITIDGLKLEVQYVIDSTVYTDLDMGINALESVTQTSISVAGSTNLIVNGDDASIGNSSQAIDGTARVVERSSMTFNKPIPLTFGVSDDWMGEVIGSYTYVKDVYSDLGIDRFDDLESERDSENNDDLEYYGCTVSDNFSTSGTPQMTVLEIEDAILIYPVIGGTMISASEADSIRSKVDSLVGEADKVDDNVELVVKFVDDDDKVIDSLTQNVKYGDTITLPEYPSDAVRDDDDHTFIGWEYNDRIWKSDMPVRSNMILEPEFAERFETLPSAPTGSGSFILDLDDLDDLMEEIPKEFVTGGNTMYITVTDSSGQELYSWKFSNGMADISNTKLIPKINEIEVPEGKDYIDDDGKDILYLDFEGSGTMPSDTVVNYNVKGKFKDGTVLEILYDNGTSLEHTGTTTVVDGEAAITLAHLSSYVLMADSDSGGNSNGGSDTFLIIAAIAAVLIIAVIAFMFVKRRPTA